MHADSNALRNRLLTHRIVQRLLNILIENPPPVRLWIVSWITRKIPLWRLTPQFSASPKEERIDSYNENALKMEPPTNAWK